ncbi:hypothetical protein AAVH_25281 [Aphelenchoides avenae]|nr:hypothetical protein AAVH_25281 [Aphelenchus avenae]
MDGSALDFVNFSAAEGHADYTSELGNTVVQINPLFGGSSTIGFGAWTNEEVFIEYPKGEFSHPMVAIAACQLVIL